MSNISVYGGAKMGNFGKQAKLVFGSRKGPVRVLRNVVYKGISIIPLSEPFKVHKNVVYERNGEIVLNEAGEVITGRNAPITFNPEKHIECFKDYLGNPVLLDGKEISVTIPANFHIAENLDGIQINRHFYFSKEVLFSENDEDRFLVAMVIIEEKKILRHIFIDFIKIFEQLLQKQSKKSMKELKSMASQRIKGLQEIFEKRFEDFALKPVEIDCLGGLKLIETLSDFQDFLKKIIVFLQGFTIVEKLLVVSHHPCSPEELLEYALKNPILSFVKYRSGEQAFYNDIVVLPMCIRTHLLWDEGRPVLSESKAHLAIQTVNVFSFLQILNLLLPAMPESAELLNEIKNSIESKELLIQYVSSSKEILEKRLRYLMYPVVDDYANQRYFRCLSSFDGQNINDLVSLQSFLKVEVRIFSLAFQLQKGVFPFSLDNDLLELMHKAFEEDKKLLAECIRIKSLFSESRTLAEDRIYKIITDWENREI